MSEIKTSWTREEYEQKQVTLSRDAAENLAKFLEDLVANYDTHMQGPIPPYVIKRCAEVSKKLDQSLKSSESEERIHISLNYFEVAEIGSMVWFFECGGEERINFNSETSRPVKPVDLAWLDLNEAFVKARGRDNLPMRRALEELK